MRNEKIRDVISDYNEEALFADGFDEAIEGVIRQAGGNYLICYSYDKCVEVLVKQGLSHEEAVENMEFNVVSAYLGEHTPVFLEKFTE